MVNVTIMPRTELPQYVPSGVCQTCDVCCHFPEADSFLRPYFMQDEIAAGQSAGIPAAHFPNLSGGQIDLVPDPTGVGYLCPAFDPVNSRCSVYESRPLDCRLYPLALMWDAAHERVMLGWDRKCPFMAEALPPDIAAHAERVSALLATGETIDRIAAQVFLEEIIVSCGDSFDQLLVVFVELRLMLCGNVHFFVFAASRAFLEEMRFLVEEIEDAVKFQSFADRNLDRNHSRSEITLDRLEHHVE